MSKRPQAEAETGSVLTRLKAYTRADPTFQRDKDASISAEAEFGASDPMEGVTYRVARDRPAEPTQKKAARKSRK
jgi:hypothetical protein